MTEYGLWTRKRMPDSPQQRHHRVLLPRYGTHFSIMHSHVVLHLRRCINSIFGTGIISQCCDGGVDPAVHPELRDLRGYAENTLLASLYGHHLICILSAMLHVGRSQPGCALPGVRKPASSVRGTCIVVPHAALLAVPDAPPRFFAHRARSAPVPLAVRACSPSQVQCCTLAVYGPGAHSRAFGHGFFASPGRRHGLT